MVNPLATLRQTKLRIDKVENASVPPNTERTLCNRSGPGVVVSLWMALGGGAAPALDGRPRVYYDGSPTPRSTSTLGPCWPRTGVPGTSHPSWNTGASEPDSGDAPRHKATQRNCTFA